MITVIGRKTLNETIDSVLQLKYPKFEILIIRNGIQDLPQDIDVVDKDVFYHGNLIKEIYVRKKEKGNALNVGISYTRNPLLSVIDADCFLKKDALYNAVKHFMSDEVVAVGGRLIVKREDHSLLETI